jgi:NAD(P)-dependent dehydrogenase (short-subunit alcohol dehydrogenase family)
MFQFNPRHWALIIGGSSGIGLATCKKLARHGMNLCIVHRDRRGAMANITPHFDQMRQNKIKMLTFNVDALSDKGRENVLDELSQALGDSEKIRMILHSVALGNLKLLAPHKPSNASKETRRLIAEKLKAPKELIDRAIQTLFESGAYPLHALADPPDYKNDIFLDAEDFARTIHAMGTNIVEWVQDIFKRGLFEQDARVLSLTSEGNQIAWRGYAAVSAAKAALESVTRAMALEFAPYGIRSNVIQAGVTETAALKAIPGNQYIKSHAGLRNPLGRLTTPEDVANFIYLLCMDEAAWVNGALLCVDGGERIA